MGTSSTKPMDGFQTRADYGSFDEPRPLILGWIQSILAVQRVAVEPRMPDPSVTKPSSGNLEM